MDKRIDKRHNCKAAIFCNCFNRKDGLNAKMLNYSEGGMYFESDGFFKKGTNVIFKIKSCSRIATDPEHCKGLRTVSLAEVRWWKEIKDKAQNNFGIGVKYY